MGKFQFQAEIVALLTGAIIKSPWESQAVLRLADETDDYKQEWRVSSIVGAGIQKKNLISLQKISSGSLFISLPHCNRLPGIEWYLVLGI
jgi:hypothetical protein